MGTVRESWSIERLVHWALAEQGLGYDGGGSGGAGGVAALGVRVDGGGGGSSGKWTDEDAIIVYDALQAMIRDRRTSEAGRLVATYGRSGTEPDWGARGSGRWELVRGRKGRAVRLYDDPRHARGLRGFEWQWVGDRPEDLDYKMLQWIAWHTALCELRDIVNTRMKRHLATGPRASAAPWDDPEPSILPAATAQTSARRKALALGAKI